MLFRFTAADLPTVRRLFRTHILFARFSRTHVTATLVITCFLFVVVGVRLFWCAMGFLVFCFVVRHNSAPFIGSILNQGIATVQHPVPVDRDTDLMKEVPWKYAVFTAIAGFPCESGLRRDEPQTPEGIRCIRLSRFFCRLTHSTFPWQLSMLPEKEIKYLTSAIAGRGYSSLCLVVWSV